MSHKPYNVTVLTLYPETFPGYLGFALAKKALNKKLWSLKVINIRDFALKRYKKVDDKTFGGGKGLILMPEVLSAAINYALENGASNNLVLPSPRGIPFSQELGQDLATEDGITFICGHFEGIDQRIITKYQLREISIGDYILSGGELASQVILDSTLRFIPNVLKSAECISEESFNNGLLEYPQYTQPSVWKGLSVPSVLLSGDHNKIRAWREEQSKELTKRVRPDLWKQYLKKTHKETS